MNMRDVILNSPEQITHSLNVNKDVRVEGKVDSIILAGMGGSGHPGDLLNALKLPKVPLTVHRSYDLPTIYTKNPLIIASSYSGNTEESLSAYLAAKKEKYSLLINTAGGKLAQLSKEDGTPIIKIDFSGMQPRHTLFASFVGLATALKNSGLAEDITDDLNRVAKLLTKTIPEMEEKAKQQAQKFKGATPIFYSSPALYFAAFNFKIQVNENTKNPAFANFFPELNHNEMVGFSHMLDAQPNAKFHCLFIRDTKDHPRIKARMDVTKELYKKWGIEVSEFEVKGSTLLEKMFYTLSFGMWVTYYLAKEYGIDPVPVHGVEDFKAKLKEVAGEI